MRGSGSPAGEALEKLSMSPPPCLCLKIAADGDEGADDGNGNDDGCPTGEGPPLDVNN